MLSGGKSSPGVGWFWISTVKLMDRQMHSVQTFFALLSLFLVLEPLFSWFELMHCNKVVVWTNSISMWRMPALEPSLLPAPLGGHSAGRTRTLPSLIWSRCCSHAARAAPEGFIHTSVMFLTRPTGCRCSGELCTGLALVNQRGWIVCAAAQPASPTPLCQSPAPFSSREHCKVFNFHLKCRYCL